MFEFRERRRFTPEEYLWLEERAETKNEYYDGEIFAMSGGSIDHNQIIINLLLELNPALRGRCRVFQSDVRLLIEAHGLYTYPDLMIVCGELKLMPDRDDTLTDACVVFEVLSTTTEGYDRTHKLQFYRSLPSLQDYVLVDQYAPRVESHSRQPSGGWLWSESSTALNLPGLDLEIPLERIYQNVDFKKRRKPRK